MCYIVENKPSALEKFYYRMHYTIFCSHKRFYIFSSISTGGTEMNAFKNEQNRTSTLGPWHLNPMDILKKVFFYLKNFLKVSSNSCMDFIF